MIIPLKKVRTVVRMFYRKFQIFLWSLMMENGLRVKNSTYKIDENFEK